MTWPWPGVKEAGLVRDRATARTGSTRVLAAVRDLTRLELVTEAVRAAWEELARTAGHALEGLAGDDWGRRYGRPVRLGKNPPGQRPGSTMPGRMPAGFSSTWPPATPAGARSPAGRDTSPT